MDLNSSGSGDACPEQEPGPSALLLLPLLLSLVWVLLDVFYSSALLGWAATRFAAFFLSDSAIHLGGIQVSLLTGRVLFKDLHYYCRDFSIRVTDGYAAFRWWQRAGLGGCSSCGGSSERNGALVLFQLNGFQLHWYNRSEVYDKWGQVDVQEAPSVVEAGGEDSLMWSLWKELQPSLHFSINKGRMLFGNHLVERSLVVYCQAAEAHYHTTEASNAYDELMHVVKLWGSEVRAVLEPSTGYTPGSCSPPPASPEGDTHHSLLQTDSATVTYSWDSPGLVPLGDTPDPKFSWDVELGSNSVINYGSYANHQRHILQTFFFPNDYMEQPASYVPQAGEKRTYTSMDITVRLSSRGSFNIPFHDEKGKLHQIGLSLGQGSEIKINQPWVTEENGYTSCVTGALVDVVVTSDLSYPHLGNANTLQLNVELHFPRAWNSTQHWDMQLSGSQVEVTILFSYVDFVNALIEDWLGVESVDLLHFVPVEWTIDVSLSEYEIYMFTSRYNWLDKDNVENARLAFCGSSGQIKFQFPFTIFNPPEQRVAFTANGQDMVVRHFVPPSSSSREAVLALAAANRRRWRVMRQELACSGAQQSDGQRPQSSEAEERGDFPMGYRGHTHQRDGWVDLACGPSISLAIEYVSRAHHPNPALPNSLRVDVQAPTVLLRVFGFLATDLLALKENYPGEYIEFSSYHSTFPSENVCTSAPRLPLGGEPPPSPPSGVPDVPQERFLDVVVDFALRNISAEFPTPPSLGQPVDAVLPSVCTAKLAVHVDYTASDTKVFLSISPFTVLVPSWPSGIPGAAPELGHVACGGLQLNCHGFTEMLCGERVEYAWLMQLQLHRISAALTMLQLAEVAGWLQATVQQVVGVADTTVEAPNGKPIRPQVEPLSEDIKYFLFDLAVGEADVHLLEGDSVLRLQSPGLDMSTCKLHAESETLGLSVQLHALTCSAYTPLPGDTQRLLEVGRVEVGVVQGDIALREPQDCVASRQLAFLKKADMLTQRLWFLWHGEVDGGSVCGCCGGCQFLDGCIERRPPRPSTESAVYTAEPPGKAESLARAAGLHSLRRSLQYTCLRSPSCLKLLHNGLLAYYEKRYLPVGEAVPSPTVPSASSDTESFVSAFASPHDSGSDTNEFFSVENVNEAGLEGHTLPEQLRMRSRSKTGGEPVGVKPEAHTLLQVLAEEDPLHSLLPSHCNQTIPLYISLIPTAALFPLQGSAARHRRQHSDSQFIFARKKLSHTRMASEVVHATPPRTPRATPTQHLPRDSCILLKLPLLLPHSRGHLPNLATPTPQPRRRPPDSTQNTEEHSQSMLAVSVSVSGPLSATLSPPITHIVTSLVGSLARHFQSRGALAVLTGCSLETSLSLSSYLSKLQLPQEDPQPFSAHISLDMAPDAFAAVQLVQSLPRRYQLHSGSSGLSVPHCSLATACVQGLQVSSLVRTHSQTVTEDADNQAMVSSLQLSLKGHCSSVQLALAALLAPGTQLPPSLACLPPSRGGLEPATGPCPGLCRLMEAGCVSPSLTMAANIVTREVSHKAVLTWEHVQGCSVKGDEQCPATPLQEQVKNKMAVSVSLPEVWAEVAAPCTGRPGPSTGGLDLLVGGEVGVAWHSRLEGVASAMRELVDTKLSRDRRVLLALVTNAARSPSPQRKAGHPLLAPVACAVRQCVAFHCLNQLWASLPAFSDDQEASIPPAQSCQEELLAAALSLATRFFSEQGSSGRKRKLRSSPVPIDPATCPSCGPYRHRTTDDTSDASSHSTGGYISGISPSPSELALPNVAFSTQQLDQTDSLTYQELYQRVSFGSVVVVRESLLPLLQALSVPTEPQLRALCHNRHQLHVDCSLQLREVTVFVLESSFPRTTPTLSLDQAAVSGHLQASWDDIHTKLPTLSLLTPSSGDRHSLHRSKRTVSGLISAHAGSVSVGVTVPLMKLARHLIETFRARSRDHRSAKPPRPRDIPIFTVEADSPPTFEDTDTAGQLPPPASEVWQFARDLVGQLSALQREALQSTAQQSEESTTAIPSSRISLSRPSSAGSAHSHSVRSHVVEYSRSPRFLRNHNVGSPPAESSNLLSPPAVSTSFAVPRPHHTRSASNVSSTSEVAIQMEQVDAPLATSPASQSPLDTSGGDLASSDDMPLSSGSRRVSSSPLPPTVPLEASSVSQATMWLADTAPLQQILETPASHLSHSVFGLLRVDSLSFSLHVETSTTALRLAGITGSVDSRQLATQTPPTGSDGGRPPSLPAYLSVMATIKTTYLGVSDRVLTESEVVRVEAQPVHCSLGLSSSALLPVATYRCLLRAAGVKAVVKQPPVLVQKRFQQLLPAFSQIYHDVFSSSAEPATPTTPRPQSAEQQAGSLADIQLPAQLPQGYTHFSISRCELVMTPLPSLSITYTVQPVMAQVETTQKIRYQLSIGSHTLRFNPREHQVFLRSLSLPTATLSGDVRGSRTSRLPQVRIELAVQPVNIDLTTDSLNQLLVLQNSFIKEVNELVQLFINIGESLPQQRWQRGDKADREQARPEAGPDMQKAGLGRRDSVSESSGVELLSLLDSCRLSLDGICITVSTPLCTALRFSTGRIDMLIMNSGSQPATSDMPASKSQLLLSGRVEINVNLALGYLQDSSEDDDFCELAYFRTKISIRNTQQSAPRLSLVSGASEDEAGQPLDTFIISIICPHLYIQSSAVEQAILFWLNCKSVYSYWQHQRKLLNEEVQEATEMFVAQIQARRPTTLQTPSLDFSKPRLVQISVSDVGACMPMAPTLHTPHSSQKAFPALVLTIREMSLVVNLSRKVASSGNFSGFCVRFANQFSLRQRTWTMDSKKNKITNCGIVSQGTFRLCAATKKRHSETDPAVVLGEKLVWAFQWDMSGIDVNANSDIGHHMSTLVRTATTIGTNLEGHHPTHRSHVGPATPPTKPPRKLHKRAMSELGPAGHEAMKDRMEEGMADLAKGTIHVSKLQSSGASRDSLKREFEALKDTEQELRKKVGRMIRRRRGFSIQRLTEIFSPTSSEKMGRGGSMRRRWSLRNPRRLFSTGDPQPSIPEEGEEEDRRPDSVQEVRPLTGSPLRLRAQTISTATLTGSRHARTVSDVSLQHSLHHEEERNSSTPTLSPSVTPVPAEEGPLPSPFPPTPLSSTPLPHSAFPFQPEAPAGQHQRALDLMASIDVEVNVTVNVESGIVKLRCREDSMAERQTSSPNLLAGVRSRVAHAALSTPPLLPRRLQGRAKDSGNDTVIILIPALNVQVHYQSIIGQSYQFPSPSSSIRLPTPTAPSHPQNIPYSLPKARVTPETPLQPHPPEPPIKQGVLSISVVVASTPEDMTLTPSLLEFVEQVVRPTIAATVGAKPDSSSDSDSGEDSEPEEAEGGGKKAEEQAPAISFPVEVTIAFHMQPSTVCLSCRPHSRVHCIVRSPNVSFVVSFSLFSLRETEGVLSSTAPPSVVTFNNLYVTGCLKTFTMQLLSPQVSTLKQEPAKMETKEALSLTLGQALTHLSRKSVLAEAGKISPASSVDDYSSHSKLHVSVVTNIASLVLGYDMRRLNDITAFRRYWYRTSLVEAVFIGSKKPQPAQLAGGVGGEGGGVEEDSSTEPSGVQSVDNSISAAIAVAATVEDFRISANVAQVMGNTNLVVTRLQCQAHADISRNELVLLRLAGGMERGEVDARGGMVAGSVLMQDVQAQVTTESHQGLMPVHSVRLSLCTVEARVDYMSSCILLAQASQLVVAVSDLWEGLQLAGHDGEAGEANIQVLAEFSWEQVQLAIHRTTTKSLMNIVQKIQDFILQQKRRSERTISIMLPADTRASKALAAYREKEKQAEQERDMQNVDPRHHWLWATMFGSLELMRALGVPARLGHHEVSLGGKITLSGQNLCLVCFHGTSFRDNEWAVFNTDQLAASFHTLAIPGLGAATQATGGGEGEGEGGLAQAQAYRRTCQQICKLQLGEAGSSLAELATVHRVTAGKGRVLPITGTNINNWLAYACIDCHLHAQGYANPTAAQQTVLKFSKRLSIQQILLVPGLTVELINDHFWPVLGPRKPQPLPPRVECSLISHFSAGISVSTNVEHYLFLHDLVTNYIEYMERHKAPLKSEASEKAKKKAPEKDGEQEETGPPSRQFTCVCWELNPLLNLLSSVSGEFNPHVSWLLERLGFKHARTTIPKWVQRGAMDPLDKAVAVAVELLVQFSAKKKLQPSAPSPN